MYWRSLTDSKATSMWKKCEGRNRSCQNKIGPRSVPWEQILWWFLLLKWEVAPWLCFQALRLAPFAQRCRTGLEGKSALCAWYGWDGIRAVVFHPTQSTNNKVLHLWSPLLLNTSKQINAKRFQNCMESSEQLHFCLFAFFLSVVEQKQLQMAKLPWNTDSNSHLSLMV